MYVVLGFVGLALLKQMGASASNSATPAKQQAQGSGAGLGGGSGSGGGGGTLTGQGTPGAAALAWAFEGPNNSYGQEAVTGTYDGTGSTLIAAQAVSDPYQNNPIFMDPFASSSVSQVDTENSYGSGLGDVADNTSYDNGSDYGSEDQYA
jgi:hypothetical protein